MSLHTNTLRTRGHSRKHTPSKQKRLSINNIGDAALFNYLCSMNLFREICAVMDAASVEYTTENICGYDVLLVGTKTAAYTASEACNEAYGTPARTSRPQAVIIPVILTASDPETAVRYAEALDEAVMQIVQQKGIFPLTIAEDRWHSQQEMMRSRLLAHVQIFTQIYARNCEVKKIDKQTAADFLSANHSYGDANCRYRYGLYLKRHTGHNAEALTCKSEGVYTSGHPDAGIEPGTLVAVATFSNARKWLKGEKIIRSYEWTRYASLPGVRLSGGMGKLLKAFIKEVHPDDIMTYADLEWSEGKVYEALGFTLEGHKEPIAFMIDASWKRLPVKPEMTECTSLQRAVTPTSLLTKRGNLYFRNLGSNKYRLKLTDYQ